MVLINKQDCGVNFFFITRRKNGEKARLPY
jgi:hypothetical protein